jgi:hypothetical protein
MRILEVNNWKKVALDRDKWAKLLIKKASQSPPRAVEPMMTVTCFQSDIYRIDTINSPDDGHMAARNMYRIEINIHEKRIVRQVGYSQRLYRDARSTAHKKVCFHVYLPYQAR